MLHGLSKFIEYGLVDHQLKLQEVVDLDSRVSSVVLFECLEDLSATQRRLSLAVVESNELVSCNELVIYLAPDFDKLFPDFPVALILVDKVIFEVENVLLDLGHTIWVFHVEDCELSDKLLYELTVPLRSFLLKIFIE